MPYYVKVILLGVATGFLSGQFGVGGGIIATPGIRLVLGGSELIALGTPLVVMIPAVMSGAYVYRRNDLIDYGLVLPLAISGIFGIALGSLVTAFVSAHFLMLVTAFIILILGLRFMAAQIEGTGEQSGYVEEVDHGELRSMIFLIGFSCGFFAGFLGLGGGVLLVPAINMILRRNLKKAFGTSLLVIAFYAIPGSIFHFLLGHVDLNIALLLILGTIPGAYLGARSTVRLPTSFVKSLFGLFLIAVAIYFIYYEILAMMLKVKI